MFGFFRTPTTEEVYEKDIRRFRASNMDDAHIARAEWEKAKSLIEGEDPHCWGVPLARLIVRDFKAPDEACRFCAKSYHQSQEYLMALPLYKMLADKGDIECMKMVGYYGRNNLAEVSQEIADEYYQRAANLGDIDCKMYLAKKLRESGDRLGAIAAFQEIVNIGKKDSGSARTCIDQIYGWRTKTGECSHQCVFCRKWFEDRDIQFFVKERNRNYGHITWEGRCICWQCFGAYDEESVDHMIDIYWGWERDPEKYAPVIKNFRAEWGRAVTPGVDLKSMDWRTVVWREDSRFAYVKPCVCCERTVDKREFTTVRFSGGDKVLCKRCLEEYDLDSLLRAGSHFSACHPDWRGQVTELKSHVPVMKEFKTLPRLRASKFTERHVVPLGNGRVIISDDPIIFED